MEFEPNAPVSDEARLLPQTKKVTLQPANPFLRPQDTPDPITTNEFHANIAPDSENTGNAAQLIHASTMPAPLKASRSHHGLLIFISVAAFSLVFGIAAGASYFFFLG